MVGGKAGRGVAAGKDGGQAHHAVVGHAALAGTDGNRRGKAAAAQCADQGGDEILPDSERCSDDYPSVAALGTGTPGQTGVALGWRAATEELDPAAGWQGYSLRTASSQCIETVVQSTRLALEERSTLDLSGETQTT